MPTSANKDIVESKYSKYGENNMIIEGFVSDHDHTTDATTPEMNEPHSHTISLTDDEHGEYMDCFPADEKGEEIMAIKSKPIPEFMKNETIGIYAFWIFMSFVIIFVIYFLISIMFWNPMANSSSGASKQ